MASPPSHSRTNSYFSTSSTPTSYRPSNLNPNRSSRADSLRDTAYNGSEGLINDSDSAIDFDGNSCFDSQHTTPSKVATSFGRPALGARFLTSLSNAQPAAAALSRKGSILHSRAKSLAAYVPKLGTANTSPSSASSVRVQAPNKIFGDLFNGESAPIRLGPPISPSKEKEQEDVEFVMEYSSSLTDRPASMFKRRDTMESTRSTPTAQTRKSSWFQRRPATSIPSKQVQQDELANLNINLSLFPNGPADPLSPASFNDLLLNATDLLQRMQTAYKEKVDFIASMQPELDAQREEVEEAETRSKHLKMQLENMGQQAQENERAMQDMSRELTEERVRVQELRENAARSIRLVRGPTDDGHSREFVDEDTPTRRGKRNSDESASDSGFESDLESVFSANSSSVETPTYPPSSIPLDLKGRNGVLSANRRTSSSTVTSGPEVDAGPARRPGGGNAAWATVETLRNENRDLKVRLEGMEKEMQSCIEFVGALNGV